MATPARGTKADQIHSVTRPAVKIAEEMAASMPDLRHDRHVPIATGGVPPPVQFRSLLTWIVHEGPARRAPGRG